MLHRNVYLENRLTLADSGTRTIDINVADPVSDILLTLRATNGATNNKENPIIHNLTKIEVVDGGDVITSLRGEVLRGLVSHIDGVCPGEYHTELANDGTIESVTIPFGRYRLDTRYAFNPNAFRNPQLKLSWDLAHVNAVGATGYVTGTLDLSVIAQVMEDVPDPIGVLTAKEVYDFTSAASGDEKIELPTDYKLRTLLVRAYENGIDMRTTLSNIKLSADGGKKLFFDERTAHMLQRQLEYYGRLENTRLCAFDNGDFVATFMGLSTLGQVHNKKGTGPNISVTAWWQSDARCLAILHNGIASNANEAFLTDRGTGFENCYVIPFGLKNEPETWLNAPQFGSLLLYLTQGNADAEVQIAVQEERLY